MRLVAGKGFWSLEIKTFQSITNMNKEDRKGVSRSIAKGCGLASLLIYLHVVLLGLWGQSTTSGAASTIEMRGCPVLEARHSKSKVLAGLVPSERCGEKNCARPPYLVRRWISSSSYDVLCPNFSCSSRCESKQDHAKDLNLT